MLDEDFSSQQNAFCRRHCGKLHSNCSFQDIPLVNYVFNAEIFEDSSENKLEYTAIFNEYTALIEGLLERKLSEKIEGFQMEQFERMLVERKGMYEFDTIMTHMISSGR